MLWGLDLAGRIGSCWGTGETLPQVEHLQLPAPGEDLGRYLSLARRWFIGRVEDIKPDLVMIEAPILPKPIIKWSGQPFKSHPIIIWPTKLETTRPLQGLTGMVEMECYDRGIPVEEAQPGEVKQQLTGHGRANKDDMVRAARKMGLDIAVHDEADAAGVWLVAVRYHARHHLHRFDRLLWGVGASPKETA